eukprot:jgi/Mesen1/6524/ME000332S05531
MKPWERGSAAGRCRNFIIHNGVDTLRAACGCLFICLVLIIFTTSTLSLKWQGQLPAPSRQKYTVLINTWKRPDLLKNCVAHYSSCSNVDSIHIVWSEPRPPLPSQVTSMQEQAYSNSGGKVEVLFDIHKGDSLNNRFKPLKDRRTDGIFSVDDDMHVPCPTLELAFDVWLSAPSAMVGFVPRMHWLIEDEGAGAEAGKYKYGGWMSVWRSGMFSMVLTKAAFLHHKYLEMYTRDMPRQLLDYVHSNRNCEDIAMSYLVANATSAPPIWVQSRLRDYGKIGISSQHRHLQHRSQCVNDFISYFGKIPLVAGHTKVVDARTSWLF